MEIGKVLPGAKLVGVILVPFCVKLHEKKTKYGRVHSEAGAPFFCHMTPHNFGVGPCCFLSLHRS